MALDVPAPPAPPLASGCGCVPALSGLPERVSALRELLAVETEPLVALTHLLRLCRDEHPTLREQLGRAATCHQASALAANLRQVLPRPGTETVLPPPVRAAFAAALDTAEVPDVVSARTLAELVDRHYGHTFAASFRSRSPYQPVVGDPIPLDSPDLRRITAMPPTAPPWRLANRLDETRRVRLAGAWTSQFKVVFDYSLFDTLAGVISSDTVLATGHPNNSLAQFGLTGGTAGPVFPLQPLDLPGQRARIDALLRQAEQAGASVVVLPELCLTEQLAGELEAWVRRPGPVRLLVAGSFHHTDRVAGHAVRVNRATTWVRDHPLPLVHDKHSRADRPVTEDIAASGWPELRVYVTSDGWHLVIAICRDLLNPNAVHALTEAGANLVLVPAMSETLVPFGGPAAQFVGCEQALVVVANNPADWSVDGRPESRRPARALFGHPGLGQQTRLVHSPDDKTGLAVLHVHTGQMGWHCAEETPDRTTYPSPEPPAADLTPSWVERLATHVTHQPLAALPARSVSLRPAAVLVLLSSGPHGPEALLTARAPDLTDYPDQIVFPGGLVEPTDTGPEAAALREAAEEIGLDPTSVHLIGTLAPLGLPETGFLVTPVLAWSAQPRFTHSANLAEVTTIHSIPLGSHPTAIPVTLHLDGDDAYAETDIGRLGAMTASVLDLVRGFLAAPSADVSVPMPGEPLSRPPAPRRRPATSRTR